MAMADTDIEHLAFSILHGTFNIDSPGGCSCELCTTIRNRINELRKDEAAKFYAEHYPRADTIRRKGKWY
jgi:hypothetical protein